MEHPILSNCEIRFTRLSSSYSWPALPHQCQTYGSEWQPMYGMYDISPYLWVVFLKLDGMTNRFVIEQRYHKFIGKFEKTDPDKPYVWINPPPPGGITVGSFGRTNIGSAPIFQWVYQPETIFDNYKPQTNSKDIESIFEDGHGYPFRHNFRDLIPIPYTIPVFNLSGNIPGMIATIAILIDQRATSSGAVMAGAEAFVTAVKNEINQLISEYEIDLTDYINGLNFEESPDVTLPIAAINDIRETIIKKVTTAMLRYYFDRGLFYTLVHWQELLNPDLPLGMGVWFWNTENLQQGTTEESNHSIKYVQQFDEAWNVELPLSCRIQSEHNFGRDTGLVTLRLTMKIFAEKFKLSKIRCPFVASTIGSNLFPTLNVLRIWRDETLNKSKFGKILIKLYYMLSPWFARVVIKSQLLKKFICITLRPIIYIIDHKAKIK